MIGIQLCVSGAVVMGDAVLGLHKRDINYSLCTAKQSFTMTNGRAGKGFIRVTVLGKNDSSSGRDPECMYRYGCAF